MKKYFLAMLFLPFFVPIELNAQTLYEDSILCSNQSLVTMIAMNTGEFNVAVCKDGNSSAGYYFVRQNRRNNELIILPIQFRNNPHQGANPWLLKVSQGRYTYQVAEFNPLSNGSYVSFSIFENGTRVYYYETDKYLVGKFGDI